MKYLSTLIITALASEAHGALTLKKNTQAPNLGDLAKMFAGGGMPAIPGMPAMPGAPEGGDETSDAPPGRMEMIKGLLSGEPVGVSDEKKDYAALLKTQEDFKKAVLLQNRQERSRIMATTSRFCSWGLGPIQALIQMLSDVGMTFALGVFNVMSVVTSPLYALLSSVMSLHFLSVGKSVAFSVRKEFCPETLPADTVVVEASV